MGIRKNKLALLIACLTISGCDLIQGIFKAGFVVGLIIAVVVVILLIKLFGGRGKTS